MTDTHIVPQDKFDLAAVERARDLGHYVLIPYYPALLEWVQDANWPVAGPVARLLSDARPEIAPHIVDILRGQDDFWQQWVLDLVVRHFDPACWPSLRPELDRLADEGLTPDVRELADELRGFHL